MYMFSDVFDFGNDSHGLGEFILYLQGILKVIADFFKRVIGDLIDSATKMGIEGKDLIELNNTTAASGEAG